MTLILVLLAQTASFSSDTALRCKHAANDRQVPGAESDTNHPDMYAVENAGFADEGCADAECSDTGCATETENGSDSASPAGEAGTGAADDCQAQGCTDACDGCCFYVPLTSFLPPGVPSYEVRCTSLYLPSFPPSISSDRAPLFHPPRG